MARPRPDDWYAARLETLLTDVWWSAGPQGAVFARSQRRDPNVRLPRLPTPPGRVRSDTRGELRELDEGFVGPVPSPVVRRPPKVPGPVAPPAAPPAPPPSTPGPSPADVLPRSPAYPQQLPGARTTRLPTLGAVAGRLGALAWVLGTLVFGPYLFPQARVEPRSSGPPRRRARPRAESPDEFPFGEDPFGDYNPLPRNPVAGVLIPQPGTTTRGTPRDAPAQRNRPVSERPVPLPGERPTVRTVPAPRPAIFDPLPGPGYDPFTYTPTSPGPATRPANPFHRTTAPPFPFPAGFPVRLPGRSPRRVPGERARPLTPQQPASSPRPLRPQQPTRRPVKPPTGSIDPLPLTPVQPDVSPLPGFAARPTSANPCTAQRTARRRRQKKCKQFTTKTIRVCAD